jgi:hypothetical protein
MLPYLQSYNQLPTASESGPSTSERFASLQAKSFRSLKPSATVDKIYSLADSETGRPEISAREIAHQGEGYIKITINSSSIMRLKDQQRLAHLLEKRDIARNRKRN